LVPRFCILHIFMLFSPGPPPQQPPTRGGGFWGLTQHPEQGSNTLLAFWRYLPTHPKPGFCCLGNCRGSYLGWLTPPQFGCFPPHQLWVNKKQPVFGFYYGPLVTPGGGGFGVSWGYYFCFPIFFFPPQLGFSPFGSPKENPPPLVRVGLRFISFGTNLMLSPTHRPGCPSLFGFPVCFFPPPLLLGFWGGTPPPFFFPTPFFGFLGPRGPFFSVKPGGPPPFLFQTPLFFSPSFTQKKTPKTPTKLGGGWGGGGFGEFLRVGGPQSKPPPPTIFFCVFAFCGGVPPPLFPKQTRIQCVFVFWGGGGGGVFVFGNNFWV